MSSANASGEYILEMNNITKRFPGVTALDSVSFNLKAGEIHALVGENGAGKSTLMKILGGIYQPDEGEIFLNGEKVSLKCSKDALEKKISIIHQELNLVPTLSIAENMFLGKEMVHKPTAILNRKEMQSRANNVMKKLGIDNIDGSELARTVSIAKLQLSEIGKSIYNNANIIVMDEPTAVLTTKEAETLFKVIEGFKNDGISVIYISHRLEEIVRLSDRITVLRDGKNVALFDNREKNIQIDTIIKNMVGRELSDFYPKRKGSVSEELLLEVKNLSLHGVYNDVSFCLNKGEILGFSGLVGAGRSEIMESVYGAMKPDKGDIFIAGKKTTIRSTTDAINAGICLVPEDRKTQGLVLGMSLSENVSLPNLDSLSKIGSIIKSKCKELAKKSIENLNIKPAISLRSAGEFSGGNQQKIVIAKWLARKPKVIILDEPTRGIDVGAKKEIYTLIQNFADAGVGVIVVSSEMLEILGICDRIISVCTGKITGDFTKAEATEELLMAAATGITQ